MRDNRFNLLCQPLVAHDQVRAERSASRVLQRALREQRQPFVEDVDAAGIGDGEGTDDPASAGGFHELDARHLEHRGRDRRQPDAPTQAPTDSLARRLAHAAWSPDV